MPDRPLTTPSGGVSRSDRGVARPPERRRPNYAARRMLVGTVVIAGAFAAGIASWRIARSDSKTIERTHTTWTSIAFVSRATGDVTYVDHQGEAIGESLANGRTTSVHGIGGAVTLVNSQRVAVLAPPGSSDPPLVVGIPSRAVATPLATGAITLLAIGNPTGGDVIVVDPASATQYDIGEIVSGTLPSTPLMFVETLRTNRDGSILAIADATNFQTIVVRPGSSEPLFLPDQPVAVGTDLIATSQTVGLQADIALVGLDRSTKAAVPTEIPAGGVFDEDRLVMVSTDGAVVRIEPGDHDAQQLGTIAVPSGGLISWAAPAGDGQRLVVAGRTFETVVDLDGATLFTTTFTEDVDVIRPDPDWRCLPIGGDGGAHSLIDLDTGDQLADLTGVTIVQVADRGCAVLGDRDGITEVITADGIATIGPVDSALLGPGGRSVVETIGDTTELVVLADDLTIADTIDLSAFPSGFNPLITFVESRES